MTISATTQGLRMGVATSSSRPTVPFDGQVISETDTDSLQVYKGTAWAPVSGLQFIGSSSPSAAATVTVDNVFTSTYTHYLITFNFTGGTTEDLRLQFRYGSTTQAASYYSGMNTADYGGTAGVVSINNGAYIPLSLDMLRITGQLFVSNVGVSSTGAMITGQIMNQQDARTSSGGAVINSTQTYTGFIFTNSTAGNIFTGTVNVYGLANS